MASSRRLTHTERSLYFFLVLAGDRNGVNFYAHDRICAALELTLDDHLVVRDHGEPDCGDAVVRNPACRPGGRHQELRRRGCLDRSFERSNTGIRALRGELVADPVHVRLVADHEDDAELENSACKSQSSSLFWSR